MRSVGEERLQNKSRRGSGCTPSGKGMVVDLGKTLPAEFAPARSFVAKKQPHFILHLAALLKGASRRRDVVPTEVSQLEQQDVGRRELIAQEGSNGSSSSRVYCPLGLQPPPA